MFNSGPADGWRRCRSSLRSEATALFSVCLYYDELAPSMRLKYAVSKRLLIVRVRSCCIHSRPDPQAPIPTQYRLRDHRQGCLSCHQPYMSLEHVKSHQDTKTNFNKLPFAAQLNTICDRMATRHGIPSRQRMGST